MTVRRHCFDSFVLDLDDGTLRRNADKVPLRPKTWTLLCYFLRRPGALATKEELVQELWPDTIVNESALANCVSELRSALGDDRRRPRYIESAARRGYRWIAALSHEDAPLIAEQSNGEDGSGARGAGLLVGRGAELAALDDAFKRACSGQRQIVLLSGEAGIGKTALVDYWIDSWGHRFPAATSAHGTCVEQHQSGEAYLAVLDALAQLCRSGDGPHVIAALHQHAPLWLAQMPALLSPQERRSLQLEIQNAARERMLREMGDVLDALAQRSPFVLALEDLHWSDRATLDLIAYLSRRRAPAQLLVLITFRPTNVLLTDHPLKGLRRDLQSRGLCREVELRLLTLEETAELLARRFPDCTFAPQLAATLHRQIGGNPMFLNAVVDACVRQGWIAQGSGGWQLTVDAQQVARSVPESLKLMIERRVEELPPESISLIEAASLQRSEISTQALSAALGTPADSVEQACSQLVQQGLLYPIVEQEWPDGSVGTTHVFTHALYHEVLSQRLPVHQRRRLHQRMAERIERGWGERSAEVCTELAHHFREAGDNERGVRYLRESSTRSLQRGATADARAAVEQALALVEGGGDDPTNLRRRIELTLGLVVTRQVETGFADARAEGELRRAVVWSEQLNEPLLRFICLAALFNFVVFSARHAEASLVSDELATLNEQCGLPITGLLAHTCRGVSRYFRGQLDAAQQELTQALAIPSPPMPLARPHTRTSALTVLSRVETLRGLEGPAQQAHDAAQRLALATGPFDSAWTNYMEATRSALCGNLDAASEHATTALEISRHYGFQALGELSDAVRHWIKSLHDRRVDAVDTIAATIARRHQSGIEGERAILHWLQATALSNAQRWDDAAKLAEQFIAWLNAHGECWLTPELQRLRGEALLELGARQLGSVCLRDALTLATGMGAGLWVSRVRTTLARLLPGEQHHP